MAMTEEEMRKKVESAKASAYRIDLTPHLGRAQVTWRGKVIVDSDRALILNETRHNPVIYFPRADAQMSFLQPTTHKTHCPFKGDASYFSLVAGESRAENAVWSYENPISDVVGIKEHLAFYTKAMGADFGIEVIAPGVVTPL